MTKTSPITCIRCKQEFTTRKLFNDHADFCSREGDKLDAEILAEVHLMMRDSGPNLFKAVFYGTNEFQYHAVNWTHFYRFLVLLARRFELTAEHAQALHCLGHCVDDWAQRVEIHEASVKSWRMLPPEKRDYMYNFALLELARAYCEQDFEPQLKEALNIASELLVLEARESHLDTDDVPGIQRDAVAKLAKVQVGS